ncbi:type II toxin-antitoxin system HicB family antitoxin [Alkalibacterium olivapovliticus]|uniref:Uncharacterized protein n=1 Tax=Alkalibacterium olivapovliticus TaxID=99907 RepID=A0A2T0W3U8_9LACT|nr:type II toxin-antitoxin system HicB family antitoxin [Alkalibacterium olivapovliticus]PRY80138.1 hypothetical protein CLV38_12128 [Alkalibacterium olivapovliticus]
MKENFTYPVIIKKSEEYIDIIFPDFKNTVTSVMNEDDYITASQELLALLIKDYLDEDKLLPEPSMIEDIELIEDQYIIFINVWMPYHQSTIKETYVKKTLTIPSWLNILAKNSNINFSQLLVKALKDELNLK